MAEFASLSSYEDFERSVKTTSRYVHGETVQAFLQVVMETARVAGLRAGKCLYRAQLGSDKEPAFSSDDDGQPVELCDVAFPFERMIPKAEYVGQGRVNPEGIPCLYLPSRPSTAIAETRGWWISSFITLAAFETKRECQLVDCRYTKRSLWEEAMLTDLAGDTKEPDVATKERVSGVKLASRFRSP